MKTAKKTAAAPTLYAVGETVEIVHNLALVGRPPGHVRFATVTRCTASNVWVTGCGTSPAYREPITPRADWNYMVRKATKEAIAKHTPAPVVTAAPVPAPAADVGTVKRDVDGCLVAFIANEQSPVQSFACALGGPGGLHYYGPAAVPDAVEKAGDTLTISAPAKLMPAVMIEAAKAGAIREWGGCENAAPVMALDWGRGDGWAVFAMMRDTVTGEILGWVTLPDRHPAGLAWVNPFTLTA